MTKKKTVMVPVEKEVLCCDSCGKELCFSDENHQNAIELSMKGVGYSAYGGSVDSEWDYQLCRECATSLKSFLDSKRSLKDLPEVKE